MDKEDKRKWLELFIKMEQTNLMGFILTVLENFHKEDVERCYNQQLKGLELMNSISKDLAENGNKNLESWLFTGQLLDSGVEI